MNTIKKTWQDFQLFVEKGLDKTYKEIASAQTSTIFGCTIHPILTADEDIRTNSSLICRAVQVGLFFCGLLNVFHLIHSKNSFIFGIRAISVLACVDSFSIFQNFGNLLTKDYLTRNLNAHSSQMFTASITHNTFFAKKLQSSFSSFLDTKTNS